MEDFKSLNFVRSTPIAQYTMLRSIRVEEKSTPRHILCARGYTRRVFAAAKEQVPNDISLVGRFNKFFSISTVRKCMEESNPARRGELKQCRAISRSESAPKILSIRKKKQPLNDSWHVMQLDETEWERDARKIKESIALCHLQLVK